MTFFIRCAGLIGVLALTGCSKFEPQSASATPTQQPTVIHTPSVEPSPVPPPAPPVASLSRTDVFDVRFKGVNDKGYPVVIMTNLLDQDIDDVQGSFRLTDATGSILHATGWTEAIPGVLLMEAGAEMENVPFGLNRRDGLMQRLRTEPEALSFTFVVDQITFMDAETE